MKERKTIARSSFPMKGNEDIPEVEKTKQQEQNDFYEYFTKIEEQLQNYKIKIKKFITYTKYYPKPNDRFWHDLRSMDDARQSIQIMAEELHKKRLKLTDFFSIFDSLITLSQHRQNLINSTFELIRHFSWVLRLTKMDIDYYRYGVLDEVVAEHLEGFCKLLMQTIPYAIKEIYMSIYTVEHRGGLHHCFNFFGIRKLNHKAEKALADDKKEKKKLKKEEKLEKKKADADVHISEKDIDEMNKKGTKRHRFKMLCC